MKLELVNWDKKDNVMHVRVSGSNDSFINVVRRFAMDEVPTLAVEDVEFQDNSSGLYDEIVAHRLGLIPIKTDLSSYRLPKSPEEVAEKSAACTLQLILPASKKGIIYAEEAESKDPKCTFVYPKMPIVKLLPKQKLEVTMTAVMGIGKEHTKWSPGLVYFKKEVAVKADKLDSNDKIKNACDGIVDNKLKVDADKLATSSRRDACLAVLQEAGATITETEDYILTVESWGQLNCKDILEEAATILIQKLDALEEQVK